MRNGGRRSGYLLARFIYFTENNNNNCNHNIIDSEILFALVSCEFEEWSIGALSSINLNSFYWIKNMNAHLKLY